MSREYQLGNAVANLKYTGTYIIFLPLHFCSLVW